MPMAANSLSFGLPCDVYVSKLFVYSEDRQTIVVRGTFLRVLGTELFSETAEETRRLRAKPCNGQAPEAMARIIGSLEPIRKQNANTFPFSSTTPTNPDTVTPASAHNGGEAQPPVQWVCCYFTFARDNDLPSVLCEEYD